MHDHKDQEECTCDHIHVDMTYTMTSLVDNDPARDLWKWFDRVFSKHNPTLKGAFHFEESVFEGNKTIEVMQYGEFFKFDALYALYMSFKDNSDPDKLMDRLGQDQSS